MSAVIETSANVVLSPAPIARGDGTRAIAFDGAGEIALATFLGQVRGVAAALPAGRHAVILCEDRYRFLVAFCAVALRGQVNLLPPSRAPAVVADVLASYADSYSLGESEFALPPPRYWHLPDHLPSVAGPMPVLDPTALVAIGFTSGSTGRPQPNPKTWGSFCTSTAQNLAALRDLWGDAAPQLVATVPPQHMYGLELSVLLPLLGEAAVHVARPFFPEDIARSLHAAQAPRVLVTTPVHLRALVEAGVAMPPLAGIVSATAPLAPELAAIAEARFGCEVRELFGSTETCVIARRRTALDAAWTPLPGVRLAPQPDGTAVHAPHLPAPVILADLVEIVANDSRGNDGRGHDGRGHDGREPDGCFLLRGRNADLLEIAGKRASLGDLTRKLLAIPGVEDGVVFQLDQANGDGVRRIAALAVAPGLDEAAILAALRCEIDPVFLPRPLKRVAALPRNDTGKLPRLALAALLQAADT